MRSRRDAKQREASKVHPAVVSGILHENNSIEQKLSRATVGRPSPAGQFDPILYRIRCKILGKSNVRMKREGLAESKRVAGHLIVQLGQLRITGGQLQVDDGGLRENSHIAYLNNKGFCTATDLLDLGFGFVGTYAEGAGREEGQVRPGVAVHNKIATQLVQETT